MPRKPAFRLGRSRTGLGLFATAPIKKRAFIVEYKGRKLTTEQADVLEARGNRYLYEINSRWTIDGTTRRNLGRYANHSCRPNAKARTVGHRVFLRAIKNIKPGDEITYNYGRDYFLNVITPRGCKCDKCRAKRAAAQAKTRAKTDQGAEDTGEVAREGKSQDTGRKAPDLSAGFSRVGNAPAVTSSRDLSRCKGTRRQTLATRASVAYRTNEVPFFAKPKMKTRRGFLRAGPRPRRHRSYRYIRGQQLCRERQ